jgi:Ca2+/Na+ antiporter
MVDLTTVFGVDVGTVFGAISILYLILIVIAMIAMSFATTESELHSPVPETEEADAD